jgi:predicted short-subunit dehydrogenase-like oxidoreductase (DUF2520 family)
MTKPTVSIVGLGRVGQALAGALGTAGYHLDALVVKEVAQIPSRQSLFPKAAALHAGQLEQLPASDLILITTPDDAIAGIAEMIALFHKTSGRQVVLHTSGALSSEVLQPLKTAGFFTGSMHPLVSVGYPPDGAAALQGAFYCLEGDESAVETAQQIVRDFGGESFHVNTESKALYHAAAVIASPHLVALFDLVLELFRLTGVEQNVAYKILLGLVDSTVTNLHARDDDGAYRGAARALTGTFARGDVGTVELHLKALRQHKEALAIYKLLGLRSLQLAEQSGLDRERLEHIRKLLEVQAQNDDQPS